MRLEVTNEPSLDGLASNWQPAGIHVAVNSNIEIPHPQPIGLAAHHGIVGRFVSLVSPHTEADPSFLVLLFLVYAGNAFGRDAYISTGGDKHYSNLYLCAVGPTSGGRKGSATGPVEMFFEVIDPEWVRGIQSGLSSGEGLIWCVRDPIFKLEKEKGNSEIYRKTCIDEGVKDKRLIIRQSEFHGALQMMKRPGNTLSPTIRDAWDRGTLNSLTKNSPARATGAHISIVGNITGEELLRGMLTDEMDNGFANRFLWACSRRSRSLPEGGQLSSVCQSRDFKELSNDFNLIRDRVSGPILRDKEAGDMWGRDDKPGAGLYNELTRARRGLFGLCTARAAPIVLRLSLIYALLDGSQEIRREHLDAAFACWRYCEDSARFIFGDALGDSVADAILNSLRLPSNRDGMTRKDINSLFQRNKKSEEIGRALSLLEREGLAHKLPLETNGRPAELWKLGGPNQ